MNDLQGAAISLRPEIEVALAALLESGAEHAMVTGSGPTGFGLYPSAEAAADAASALRDRFPERAGHRSAFLVNRLPISRKWIRRGLVAAAVVAFLLFRDKVPSLNLEQLIEDLSAGLGAWTYLLVGGLAFLETGAFVGLVAPGEFTVMLGGAVAQQGDVSLPVILAIMVRRLLRRLRQLPAGREARKGIPGRARPRVRITEERLRQVEDYFSRRQR